MTEIPEPVPPPPGFDHRPPAPPPMAPPPMAAPPQRGNPPPDGPSKILLVFGLAGLGVGGYALQYALGRSYLDEEALLHGSLIGGLGLVFFCLWLRKAVNPALASVVLIAAIGVVGYFAMGAFDQQRVRVEEAIAEDQFFASISPVCTYETPLPEARGYVPGGANTAVFFTQPSNGGAIYPSRYGVTDEFRAETIEDLALVVCTSTESLIIEMCPYSTSNGDRIVSREQYVRTVRLVDPTTAVVLDTRRLEGSIPNVCSASRTFSEYETSATNYGSLPSDIDVIAEIRPWLNGTATVATTGAAVSPGSSATAPPGNGAVGSPGTGTSNVGTPVPGIKPGDEPPPSGKP